MQATLDDLQYTEQSTITDRLNLRCHTLVCNSAALVAFRVIALEPRLSPSLRSMVLIGLLSLAAIGYAHLFLYL